MGSEVDIMNVVLEMENWIVNDEYFITQGLNEYEVYNCGDDAEEAKELYTGTFEECLTWIWNSI